MSKKIILLCLFLSYSFFSIAQRDTTWQVGVITAPSFYWKYNSHEFNTVSIKSVSPDFPNSFIWGITLQKPLTERWNFKTGIEYSTQSQKFISSNRSITRPTDNGESIRDYTFNCTSRLDISYLSIPLQFSYQIPIGTREKWSFFTAQGLQVSILTNYYSKNTIYEVNYVGVNANPVIGDWFSSFIQTPTKIQEEFKNNSLDYDFGSRAYRRFVLGYSSSYGFQRKLGERFTASLATRFDFDFTNADNVDGMLDSSTAGMYNWDEKLTKNNRPISHNIRLGVELGVRYTFGFKKRKPKVNQSTEIIKD